MYRTVEVRSFSNIGYSGAARAFPGFVHKQNVVAETVAPREALRVEMSPGDIVAIRRIGNCRSVLVSVFDDDGRLRPDVLGLSANAVVDFAAFNSEEFKGWIVGNGAVPAALRETADVILSDDVLLRARDRCTAWVLHPILPDQLVAGASIGLVEVAVQPSPTTTPMLPSPLGEVRDEFTVTRGTATAYAVRPGEFVQIIDVEGQQCSDFMALRRRPLDVGVEATIDSTATRTMVHGAYPGPGLLDKFYDSEMRPMLRVVQDTCGQHDTFGLACTARGYEDRGFPGHINCSDNISGALAEHGVARRAAWPAINFFWSTWLDRHSNRLLTEESHSRPGDYVVMEALDDLVCVTTACPDDLDPINGWNPTDVHVRIYRPDAPIRRAVAYRENETATMSLTRESPFHPSTSRLTTQFAPSRDLWLPVSFPSEGTIGEYWACRERVTLQDLSSLRKYDVVGPDAERLLQRVLTKNISRLSVWRGVYALICDETGSVVDDGTLFRLGHELFRWCCGSEESARILKAVADEEGLQVRINGMGGALPNVAIQGPRSRDLLRKLVFTQPTVPSLGDLKWFGVTVARLNDGEGAPFMLSRTGYTGELGYELFCSADDATALWDALMAAGEEFRIAPMGAAALAMLRIEAGFAASGAEFAPGVDAHEAGLGFAISPKKGHYIGQAALERNAQHPRKVLKGLLFEGAEAPLHGASVYAGERPVGVVTSATWSPQLERAIAMVRLAVEYAEVGRPLEVGQLDGRLKRLRARVCEVPFFDAKRERARG